jgi:HAD superfamily hydrolase (TIGR01509 family)
VLKFQAIFLDRVGTLSRNSPEKLRERNQALVEITGHGDLRRMAGWDMDVFWRVLEQPGIKPVNTVEREDAFWRKWYQLVLEDHGVPGDTEALAAGLYERFCFYRMMAPFPETVSVLEALKAQGYRMGVISDTFPSLEESLQALGIAHYFEAFTASSLVGAGKPDPRIFRAATDALGVTPQGSVFVDDCRKEADGAREQGFTAFHLDRRLTAPDYPSWTIGNLEHLLELLSRS